MPATISGVFYRKRALSVFAILMAGMLIDVDHLLATPVYDPLRCSMGFHPLHTWPAVVVYALLCVYPRTRLMGFGLMIHMLLDTGDCVGSPGGLAQLSEKFW